MSKSGELFDSALTVLPDMHRDETLYSWCARYHALTANRLAMDTALQLFGPPVSGVIHDFPSHLGSFVVRTGGRFGDVSTLAMKHTLLGFYAPFKQDQVVARSIEAMTGLSAARIKFSLGLPSSRVSAVHPLKACAVCADEDQTHLGHAFWHMEHQWPSVWICHRHRCWLRHSIAKLKGVLGQQWLLPNTVAGEHWRDVGRGADARPALERMQAITRGLVAQEALWFDRNLLRLTYLAGVKRMGLMRPKGNIRLREVRDSFLYCVRGIETVPGFQFVQGVYEENGGFLGELLRAVRGDKHPAKHILLMAFLFNDCEDFLHTYRSMSLAPASEPTIRVGRARASDPRRQELALLLKPSGPTITQVARNIGLDLDTAIYWAKLDGVFYRRRPRAIRPQNMGSLIAGLLAGAGPDELAQTVGVPRRSVTNFIKAHPDIAAAWRTKFALRQRDYYRARMLRLIADHPHATRSELRRMRGSGYMWLYRHDRDWLGENLPSLWLTRAP